MAPLKINYFHLTQMGLEIIHTQNCQLSYPAHNHTSIFTINLILKGELTLIKQQHQHYVKNDCFLIAPYQTHAITTSSSYDMLCICIKSSFLETVSFEAAWHMVNNASKQLITKKQTARIKKQLKLIYTSNYLIPLSNNQYTALTKSYELQSEQYLKLDQLARTLHKSKFHLLRKFKQVVGLTPHKFQLQKRIRKAQQLLNNNTLSMTEIALATGFYDQSHFIRHFKHLLRITPSDYQAATSNLFIASTAQEKT